MGKIKYPIEICAMCKKTGFAVDMVQTTIEGNNQLYVCVDCQEEQNLLDLSDDEILELLDEKDIDYCSGEYCEPGYSSDKLVLFFEPYSSLGDYPTLQEIVEGRFEVSYLDEYVQCEECNKFFRTSPDSYSWIMYGKIFDGFVLCGDCIKEDSTEYIEQIINNPNDADTIGVDLESLGFERIDEEFNSGLYENQSGPLHDPKSILKEYQSKFPDHDFIFRIDYSEQFQIIFSLYKRGVENGQN